MSYAWRRACGTGKLAGEERTSDPSTHLEPARSPPARMTRRHDEPSDHATQAGSKECVKFEAFILRRSRKCRLGLKMAYCYRQHHTQSLAFPPSERQSSAYTSRRKICLRATIWQEVPQFSCTRATEESGECNNLAHPLLESCTHGIVLRTFWAKTAQPSSNSALTLPTRPPAPRWESSARARRRPLRRQPCKYSERVARVVRGGDEGTRA